MYTVTIKGSPTERQASHFFTAMYCLNLFPDTDEFRGGKLFMHVKSVFFRPLSLLLYGCHVLPDILVYDMSAAVLLALSSTCRIKSSICSASCKSLT